MNENQNLEYLRKILPNIISKDLKKEKYNPERIYSSLLKETEINPGLAKTLTNEVTRYLFRFNVETITPPLIREILNTFLLKHNKAKFRFNYTRVGIPYFDLKKLMNRCHRNEISRFELKEIIFKRIAKEYSDLKKLIKNLNGSE
jgi:ribonucleoside-triphosphate reductase